MSTATAYIGFIDFTAKELVRPEVSSSLRVQLLVGDEKEPVPTQEENAVDAVNLKHDGSKANEEQNPDLAAAELGKETVEDFFGSGANEEQKSCLAAMELDNEDEEDFFGSDDLDDYTRDPKVWHATVLKPTEVTPREHLMVLLERRRNPFFVGLRAERPFVDLPLRAINIRAAKDLEDLKDLIASGPSITVSISMAYSNQSFKDQVRCNDQLWRRNTEQKRRITKALLCHDTENSPLQKVDVLALKGESTLDLTLELNVAQKATHDSLAATSEITLIHGPFGTGKTRVLIGVAVETVSNPKEKNQVLYTVVSNQGVDEAAERILKTIKENKLDKKIIRLHSLQNENSETYKLFDIQRKPQDRYAAVPDEVVSEIASLFYLNQLGERASAARSRGDPRRQLPSMSLAQAMYDMLIKADRYKQPKLWEICETLKDYGSNGFGETDPATRKAIKLALSELMAYTIQSADIIVCTVAAAAKVDLAANFKPVVVILDEAARVTEFQTCTLFGSFEPVVFIMAADHKQLRAFCATAGLHLNKDLPYLNPFQQQFTFSAFERFVAAGFAHYFLSIQHRCKGDIPGWISKTFYHGQVQNGPDTKHDRATIHEMRKFVKSNIGSRNSPIAESNIYLVNIGSSKSIREECGTSLYNESEVMHIVKDVLLMRSNPEFLGKTILVISFYKAQISKLKIALRQRNLLKGINAIRLDTVDSVQGKEADVVLVSFVNTHNAHFIDEPHRLNVALSRARYLLGLYANLNLISRPEKQNRNIKSLFESLKVSGRVVAK